MNKTSDKRAFRAESFFVTVIGLLATGYLLQISAAFVLPFILAVLFSLLFTPVLVFLEKKGLPNFLGVALILIFILVFFGGLGFLIYGAFNSVANGLGKYNKEWQNTFTYFSTLAQDWFELDLKAQLSGGKQSEIMSLFSPEQIFNTIRQSIGSIGSFISSLLIILVFMIFMMANRKSLYQKVLHFLQAGDLNDQDSHRLLEGITHQIQSYLFLKTLISVVTGAVFGFVAYLFGLDFPIFWAFLAFILNFIPSLGPLVATVPAVLLAFLQFESNTWALIASFCMAAVQFTSGNIVEPKIMGDRLNLNFLVVLLSLFAWGMVWGFVGMVLAVPLTALLNIILNSSDRYRHISTLLGS